MKTAWRWAVAAWLTAIGSCCALREPVGQAGLANRVEQPSARAAVRQSSRGDAINVSPSLAFTGSGGLAIVAMLMLMRESRRSRRALVTVVRAVEQLPHDSATPTKHQITRRALADGTADYLHGVVKRHSDTTRGRHGAGNYKIL